VLHFDQQPGLLELYASLEQQLHIAQVTVTQRMIVAKSFSQSGVQRMVDFRTHFSGSPMAQYLQACEPHPWCAMTPS
jgi:hypothetical protein